MTRHIPKLPIDTRFEPESLLPVVQGALAWVSRASSPGDWFLRVAQCRIQHSGQSVTWTVDGLSAWELAVDGDGWVEAEATFLPSVREYVASKRAMRVLHEKVGIDAIAYSRVR